MASSLFTNNLHSQVINEIMSSNYNFILDYQGEDSDWIELFNDKEDTVFLKDYFLSDNEFNLQKWKFPDVYMCPDSFLLVFASGKDTVFENGEIHAGFSIEFNRELILLSSENHLIDSINSCRILTNKSLGRNPSQQELYQIFDFPTPGSINCADIKPFISFSDKGGIYENKFSLILTSSVDSLNIFYTINGSTPDTSSMKVLGPLYLDENLLNDEKLAEINQTNIDSFYFLTEDYPRAIVIRAALFDSVGVCRSEIFTQTYLIGEHGAQHILPVVSICAEYADLFDYNYGIFVRGVNFNPVFPDFTGNYYMRGDEWERRINVEMYDDSGELVFNQNAGLRTHGGRARLMQQKGMKIFASESYGNPQFSAKLFESRNTDNYKRLVLKPFMASWSTAGVEDYLANKIIGNLICDNVYSEPCVLYVNGHYWGMYYVSEKIDEYYIESNFGGSLDDCQVVETWGGHTSDGISTDFTEMYDFVESHSLIQASNFNEFSKDVDISRFVDYIIAEMFLANYDWPANNNKCWTDEKSNLWRWIFFDGDACFAQKELNFFEHISDTSDNAWPVNRQSSLFYRRVFENEAFRHLVFARLEFLLKTDLSYKNTSVYLSEIYPAVNSEVENQMLRYNYPDYIDQWIFGLRTIDDFLISRPCILREHIRKQYGYKISVNDCNNDDLTFSQFDVFPNPGDGNFSVLLNADFPAKAIIRITDAIGKTYDIFDGIIYGGNSQMTFNCSEYPSGVYMLTIFYHNNYYGKQIVFIK